MRLLLKHTETSLLNEVIVFYFINANGNVSIETATFYKRENCEEKPR